MHGVGAAYSTFSLFIIPYGRRNPQRLSLADAPAAIVKLEVQYMKKKYRPECPTDELGGYEQVPISEHKVIEIEQNQPTWRVSWLKRYPKNRYYYLAAPQALRIDPTYCPIRRRRTWESFECYTSRDRCTWLNYPILPAPAQGRMPTEKYMVDTLQGVINQLRGVPDLACIMLCKIAKMICTCITKFNQLEQTGHPWTKFFEGGQGLCWDLTVAPTRQTLMGLYARVIFLPSHFILTFEEAFYTGFFEVESHIFSLLNQDLCSRFIAFMRMEVERPLREVLADMEEQQRLNRFRKALEWEKQHARG